MAATNGIRDAMPGTCPATRGQGRPGGVFRGAFRGACIRGVARAPASGARARLAPAFLLLAGLFAAVLLAGGGAVAGEARIGAFEQAVAAEAAKDPALAAFYRENAYKGIWTGRGGKDAARRRAFLAALERAADHGLPAGRYDPARIRAALKGARAPAERGKLDVQMSRMFLQYAQDIQSGVLEPGRIDPGIVRKPPRRDRLALLKGFVRHSPKAFLKALAPRSPEYLRLMKAKLQLERKIAKGGWGAPVAAKSLKPGQSGPQVAALRKRLAAMGYMRRSNAQGYDAKLQKAVQLFQHEHGLPANGIADRATLAEINRPAAERLRGIIVAMERERWLNFPRGKRHVLVNITDFTAKIIDNGKVTFETRAVVGADKEDRRTPEFSDLMEFMVVNPTWNVPRSITVKEYLPQLKRNPNAVRHLQLVDGRGRKVGRSGIDFTQYDERTFPFNLKQPPSRGNALGLVKFMFPNPYNIYLHDTPQKKLFRHNVRAYSHGCIRLQKPFEFAYALLAPQMKNPKEYFHKVLATGRETQIDLKEPVPVHLIYRTAFTTPKGRVHYRRDIYGRDAKIFRALSGAGVAIRGLRG